MKDAKTSLSVYARSIDALTGFLDGPRAHGAFLLRALLEPPWCLRVQDRAPLTVVVMADGEASIAFDDGAGQRLHPGHVAVIRGPDPYTVADSPGTEPSIVIHPSQHCTTPDGQSLSEAMDLGVRTWGNSETGSVKMLVGTYQTDGEVSRRLLDSLPRLTVVASDSWDPLVSTLLLDEIGREEPAQEVVLDRLLDLVLVQALRSAFSRPGADVPAWYRAYGDPVVGRVLRMMHNDPSQPWTVAGLAREVGVSRAALARRFLELVGETPIAFLTRWRMALASDLLLEEGATVTAVSRRVGYGSPFTFSTAFKRTYGVNPRDHRERNRAARVDEQTSLEPRPVASPSAFSRQSTTSGVGG